MEKLLTFFSIFRLNLFLMAAASVAQAGTKQEGWVTASGNFGVNITGFADDGVSKYLHLVRQEHGLSNLLWIRRWRVSWARSPESSGA